jgi:hypothetical protein
MSEAQRILAVVTLIGSLHGRVDFDEDDFVEDVDGEYICRFGRYRKANRRDPNGAVRYSPTITLEEKTVQTAERFVDLASKSRKKTKC